MAIIKPVLKFVKRTYSDPVVWLFSFWFVFFFFNGVDMVSPNARHFGGNRLNDTLFNGEDWVDIPFYRGFRDNAYKYVEQWNSTRFTEEKAYDAARGIMYFIGVHNMILGIIAFFGILPIFPKYVNQLRKYMTYVFFLWFTWLCCMDVVFNERMALWKHTMLFAMPLLFVALHMPYRRMMLKKTRTFFIPFFWFVYWGMNSIDVIPNLTVKEREDSFGVYFASIGLRAWGNPILIIAKIVEALFALLFLLAIFTPHKKDRYAEGFLQKIWFMDKVRAGIVGTAILFVTFIMGDIFFGDQYEVWEHASYLIFTFVHLLTFEDRLEDCCPCSYGLESSDEEDDQKVAMKKKKTKKNSKKSGGVPLASSPITITNGDVPDVLIINGYSSLHPDGLRSKTKKTLSQQVVTQLEDELENFNTLCVATIHIEELDMSPATIQHCQELITQTQAFVFVYPVHWYNMPGKMKYFIDSAFVSGVAYKFYTERNWRYNPLIYFTTWFGSYFFWMTPCFRSIAQRTGVKRLLDGKVAYIFRSYGGPSMGSRIFPGVENTLDRAVLKFSGVSVKGVYEVHNVDRKNYAYKNAQDNFIKFAKTKINKIATTMTIFKTENRKRSSPPLQSVAVSSDTKAVGQMNTVKPSGDSAEEMSPMNTSTSGSDTPDSDALPVTPSVLATTPTPLQQQPDDESDSDDSDFEQPTLKRSKKKKRKKGQRRSLIIGSEEEEDNEE